jgi:hypothetical protein
MRQIFPMVIACSALAACADNRGPTAVSVVPPSAPKTPNAPSPSIAIDGGDVLVCHKRQFIARGVDDRGRDLVARGVTWSSSDTLVGPVSSSGLVTGVSPGLITIRATSGTETAAVRLAVFMLYPEVDVLPRSATIEVGTTTQLGTNVFAGNDLLLSNASVTWKSQSPEIATVSATGLVTALSVGVAEVDAFYAEQSTPTDTVWCSANETSGIGYVHVTARAP